MIRRVNLLKILRVLEKSQAVDLWVGRDLGYRGGRRTGLALTDECSLHLYASHLGLSSLDRSTSGPPVKERTAENIFKILQIADVSILTWNVFPLHPREAGKPFTNRQHTKAEASVGFDFLQKLGELFQVRNVIAIGNDAAIWTRRLNARNICVRHPSYGGQSIFLDQMRQIYQLPELKKSQGELF
jgi:hypothetical protein